MKKYQELAFEAADDYCKCNPGEPCEANAYMRGFEDAFRKVVEMAAHKAKHWGYTFDYDKKHQPWAKEANRALRTQNNEIAKEILKFLEEEV